LDLLDGAEDHRRGALDGPAPRSVRWSILYRTLPDGSFLASAAPRPAVPSSRQLAAAAGCDRV